MSDDIVKRIEALESAVRELCSLISEITNPINGNANHTNGNVKSRPASYDDVRKYVVGNLKLGENDAAALWEHWEGNGFKVNGKAMRSWKATASCWERCKLFYPSFRNGNIYERPRMDSPDRRRPTVAQAQGRLRL